MPDLPAKATFTGTTVTEGGFRTAFDDMIDYLSNTLGGNDTRIEVFSGDNTSRPATTSGGWIRYNTTYDVMDVSIDVSATPTWRQLVHSTYDATWKWLLNVAQESGLKINNGSGTGCKMNLASTSGSVDIGVDADEAYINSSGTRPIRLQIGGAAVFKMESSGDLTVSNNVIANGSVTISDKRLKKDIKPIENATKIIKKMNGYTFTKKRNNEKSGGIIAQEVLNAYPEAVRTYKEGDCDYLAVDYSTIIGPLINSIKELDIRIKQLEDRNDDSK